MAEKPNARVLDFSKRAVPYMDVVMPDGARLTVLEPTKDLYEAMVAFEDGDEALPEKVGELFALAAEILSNNREGTPVPEADVERDLPVSACRALLARYWKFVGEEVLAAKN